MLRMEGKNSFYRQKHKPEDECAPHILLCSSDGCSTRGSKMEKAGSGSGSALEPQKPKNALKDEQDHVKPSSSSTESLQ